MNAHTGLSAKTLTSPTPKMTDYKKYNDQLFSRWAPVYDGFELILADVRKKMVREMDSAGKSVLDVATGTGSLAIELSQSANQVVGIDLSADMLAAAERKKRTDNLAFLKMDASNLEFDDESFDLVTISLGLHDMPAEIRTLVLQEVKRVLKKEGRLYLLEYDLPKDKFLGFLSSRFINLFESQYYLDFIASDFEDYLKTCGFRLEKKTNYFFNYLRGMSLTKA